MLALEALEKYNEALEKTSGIDIEKNIRILELVSFYLVLEPSDLGKG